MTILPWYFSAAKSERLAAFVSAKLGIDAEAFAISGCYAVRCHEDLSRAHTSLVLRAFENAEESVRISARIHELEVEAQRADDAIRSFFAERVS